jgi:RNA polymerase sigma-70 factor (ECF subfamily)
LPAPILHNENELLLQVAAGNERAFQVLFDHYWENIYAVSLAFTKSAELSEEIVQDVFIKIWLKRDQLSTVNKFDGYLFTVARNHIYNTLRKKVPEQPFFDHMAGYFVDTAAVPGEEMIMEETKQLIDKAVHQLPAQQRAVFELSRYQGLDHAAIGKELGISKLTVKSHLTKALKSVRENYLKYPDGLLYIACFSKIFHKYF